jgi:hypothetical protein
LAPATVRFVKKHSCGSDIVVFDARAGRRIGVACDQDIAVEPAPVNSNADAFMRNRNADGAEAGPDKATPPAAWQICWRGVLPAKFGSLCSADFRPCISAANGKFRVMDEILPPPSPTEDPTCDQL